MPMYSGESQLSDVDKAHLNISLGKLCFAYRKHDGNRVLPGTLVGYLDGLNRFFASKGIEVDVHRDSTFTNLEYGYMKAVNRIIKQQQTQQIHRKTTNVILVKEIETMISHHVCNPNTPKGHMTRLIITVSLPNGLRATSLRLLKWSKFKKKSGINDDNVWRYTGNVGCEDGSCKNSGGG